MELERINRILAEKNRIENLFEEGGDENQKALVSQLIEQAAFMAVTLSDLQEVINDEGTTDQYQNGSQQWGRKVSATLQSFCAVQKNYVTVIKTLSAIMPPKKNNNSTPSALRVPTPEEREVERQRQEKLQQEREAEFSRAVAYQRLQNAGYNVGSFPGFDPEDWREALATV